MKYLKIFALLVALNSGAWILPQTASAQQGSASYQIFYDDLSPYGTWVDNPSYGYVWIPNGEPGFSPYATAGHWVFTDDGWTWVSDYPWGWAAFHYGRWDHDDVYGWFWVPDDEWGPAWVSWRSSPGYYGWAPLRPGISVSIAFGREYHERDDRWIFVRDRDITRADIGRRYVNRSRNVTLINQSTVIVNTRKDDKRNATYITGPNRDDVQKITHTTVKPIAIRESDKPGHRLSNGELQVYRPQVQKRNGNGQNPAPAKVAKLNEIRPASERTPGNRQQEPRTVDPPNKVQPPQQRNVNPPDGKGREQQQRTVKPPEKVQPPPQGNVSPSENKGREKQQRAVKPPEKVQPPPQRNVSPSDNKGRGQQPSTIQRPDKGRPPQVRDANPSGSKARKQQPRTVNPPNKSQPPKPQNVNPSNNGGKGRQPQNIAPPNRNPRVQPSQPKTKRDEKGAGNMEKKASTLFTRAILTICNNKLFIQSER